MKQKKILNFVLVFLVSFTILFGAYQLFVDDVEAGIFDCGSNKDCGSGGGDGCGGSMDCECNGGPQIFYCWPGTPE